jgi:hypothetical protein
MRPTGCLTVSFLCVIGPAAQAQNAPQSPLLSDESVRRVLTLALDNIQRGLCENNQPCAPASEAERQNPPITISEARAIMHRGVLSGAAQHCDLDWLRRNFQPMMAHWRHTIKKNPRQMTFIGFVHGITQGMTGPKDDSEKKCPDQMRQNLELALTFKP